MKLSRVKRPARKALWWQIQNPSGQSAKPVRWIRPRSKRLERAMAEYRREREAFLAGHPVCQAPGCRELAQDVHHTRGRVGALLLLTEFWRALCRRHHDWVQAHPREARELGLLCQDGLWNVPPES